jgi:hypothetical protein
MKKKKYNVMDVANAGREMLAMVRELDKVYAQGDEIERVLLGERNTGDGLAEFIALELEDVCVHDELKSKQEMYDEAHRAITRARIELERVEEKLLELKWKV